MKIWSDVVDTVQLDCGEAATLRLALADAERELVIDLVGRPGPGLTDRFVTWERTVAPDTRGDTSLELPRRGVLIEATALDGGGGPSARIIWYDDVGENLLELTGFSCEVGEGSPVVADDSEIISYRRKVVEGVRRWIAEWRNAPKSGASQRTVEEFMSGTAREPEKPLSEALGRFDYSPATHTPAVDLEIVTLGELAKLERLRIHSAPCSHMRIPHIYCWLTKIVIPTGTVALRLPPPEAFETLLGGDDCPECVIEFALEAEGVAF